MEQRVWLLPQQNGLVSRTNWKISTLNWNQSFALCSGYYYNIAICDFDPAEDNYEDFCNLASTRSKKHSHLKTANRDYEVNDDNISVNFREALHVGQMPFPNPGDVYFSMINVFMETQMHDIEFVLNAGYKTLIYDGNFDIICNHSGILDMIADMQWDGKADYDKV